MTSLSLDERIASLAGQLSPGREAEEFTSGLIRQAAKLVVEQMLDAEVGEVLGRQRYERTQPPEEDDGQAAPAQKPGAYRNGHKPRQLRCAEGKVPIDLPQVRGAEGWSSPLWQSLRQRTEVLDKLVVEMYARGLSTRDIEDLLGEIDDGDKQSLLSKSSVSRITEVLWEEFESFAQRDLSGFDVVYLFCDAVYESLRQQAGCK